MLWAQRPTLPWPLSLLPLSSRICLLGASWSVPRRLECAAGPRVSLGEAVSRASGSLKSLCTKSSLSPGVQNQPLPVADQSPSQLRDFCPEHTLGGTFPGSAGPAGFAPCAQRSSAGRPPPPRGPEALGLRERPLQKTRQAEKSEAREAWQSSAFRSHSSRLTSGVHSKPVGAS